MLVGVPKEIKVEEYRVGLTPAAVREYVARGHTVIVETGAGSGIGATDGTYREAGASIADSAEEVFATAEMIVKVKEPQPRECAQLREGQILFTYLHRHHRRRSRRNACRAHGRWTRGRRDDH